MWEQGVSHWVQMNSRLSAVGFQQGPVNSVVLAESCQLRAEADPII
jgi:hypothetical protein